MAFHTRTSLAEVAGVLFVVIRSASAKTFCTRAINNHRYHLCPLDVITSPEITNDPINCIDEPDGYRSDFMSLAEWRWNGDCIETTLIDDIPQGINASVAVECGTIPGEDEDEDWVTLMCYYDQVTHEFCGSTTGGSDYQCFPLDSRASFLTVEDGSCEFLTEIKAGSCDEDVVVPQLEEPEVTDDYLNGRNKRVLEARHPCSFVGTGAQLDTAGASDTRRLRMEFVSCTSSSSPNAPEKCSDVETYELQVSLRKLLRIQAPGLDNGKRILEVGGANILVQRQGSKTDNICFLFQRKSTIREECEARCFGIERNMGIQREISIGFYAIDADNCFSEEIYFTIMNDEDEGEVEEEAEGIVDSSSSSSSNITTTAKAKRTQQSRKMRTMNPSI